MRDDQATRQATDPVRDGLLRLATELPGAGACPARILAVTRAELARLGADLRQALVVTGSEPPGLRVAARDPEDWEPDGADLSARLVELASSTEESGVRDLGADRGAGRLLAVPLSFGGAPSGYWILGGLPAPGVAPLPGLDDWLLCVGSLLAPHAVLAGAASAPGAAGPHTHRLAHMGRFVAGIAHELGSPLQSVVSLAELLLRDPGRTDAVSCARRILRAALRCRGITEDLLTYARRGPPRLGPVRIQEAVLDALDLDPGSEEGITGVELDDRGEVPPVTADARRLAQVFLNLIGNARQAIQARGGGRIRVRIDALPASASRLHPDVSGTVVRVAVEDDGPGIAPEIAPRIFDPFFTTKDVGEGTGLGLSVSRTLVEDMGGRLWLDVDHSPGARFVVELPAATDGLSVAGASPGSSASGPRGPRRLLLVDDDRDVLDTYAEILTLEGFEVDSCERAGLALERLAKSSYDAVLCDVRLPDMGAPEFLEEVRLRRPDLADRIVFATGDVVGERTRVFLEAIPNPALYKPFRIEDLQQAIASVIERS